MSFPAAVVSVMLASPGDVAEARTAVADALHEWNESNASTRGIVLLPLRWESGVVPQAGAHPQDIINHQLLERADVVFALFGSRIGAATEHARSGTVEEVEGAVAAGKPVHVYFSTAPHPNDVELTQLQALREFQDEFRQRGLYGGFATPSELTTLVWKAIEADLASLGVSAETVALAKPEGAILRVQQRNAGNDHWLEIRNDSELTDAESLTVSSSSAGMRLFDGDRPRTLHAATSRDYHYFVGYTGVQDPHVELTWTENGEEKSRRFEF
ncbi:DUF4062 domain-containing protein [Microbacterium esteraromaticum]|uniref:DUF4062 domain-containing protein n=1 Tax=Microbacterium esteraromaticum TaxID=57043 RepID=UPI001CD68C55|nr:DUF4062 domain-containing protein [Microbacterium esteraromaticum]MCA1306504.1 DUF4062 domain-containing protein [Microbacterium esteraromaticum]